MPILRGEVYFIELGPTRGKELDSKRRQVVVLSINDLNSKPLVVTVVPGKTYSPGKRVFSGIEVKVEPVPGNGLRNPTLFQCFQVKAVDHGRFDAAPVGILAAGDLQQIEATLKLCLGLP